MLQTTGCAAASTSPFPVRDTRRSRPSHRSDAGSDEPAATLERALELIGLGRPRAADELLTAALLDHPGESDLWLAAGLARFRRGRLRSASAALMMCAWIADEPLARDLLRAIDGQ